MGRFKQPQRNSGGLQFKYKVNEYIRAPQVLVIDEEGESLGVMETGKAVAIARERELDLVEVSPNANPPVTKIISWSKFKYEQSKKKKESKGKSVEQKEMWFKVHIGEGDLEHKLKKVREFLAKKHPVKLTVRAKGRTDATRMRELMVRILEILKEDIVYDNTPKFEGRNFICIVRSK